MSEPYVYVKPKVKRKRKMRCDSKYNEKFTKQLVSGIRYKEGLSKVELCRKWRISDTTFDDWYESIPEFADAYNLSKMDYAAYWHEINKAVAKGEIKGNAGCVVFALTNIEKIKWSSRVEVNSKSESQIGTININILEAPKAKAIEHQATIEGEIVPEIKQIDNVVKLHDN